ncbi:protein kinase STUNTED-like [Silene latifolia]|uniref:protein kinase STUNTED-like n=1 Tax=Silene latifolia TaxID=37657 RepID=UPI003D77A1B7
MTIVKENKGFDQTRKLLVGIRFDNESKELLDWALVMVANPQDHVVAIHVSRNSGDACKEQNLLDDYLKNYKGLCEINKVKLSGKLLFGKSIKKSLVKEAKDCAAKAVILGISKFGALGSWVSTAKYCTKHLSSTTEVFTVHNGKVIFKRRGSNGSKDLKPSIHKPEKGENPGRVQSEVGDSESLETDSSDGKSKAPKRSVSFNMESPPITEQRPGWPLLRRTSLPTQKALDSRKMSVVQWAMGLPDRTPPDTPQSSSGDSCSSKSESPVGRDSSCDGVFSRKSDQSLWNEWLEEHGISFESSFLEFTWFSYEVLCHATSHFSAGNLIGKGGCSRVYKGNFLDGKQVAVKVLKSSKQAWKDFSLEVNIISSLRHRHITPLLGVCVDNSELICVYDYMSKGSLEENLHADNKEKSVLSWEVRYNVAVGVAEALLYLHTGCSRPIIHRDVKSSNILLSDNFEPQLSDFGLAIWGPNESCFETYTDVVGTFGYLAPEYFMYGKVTDKLDVYSFGVVLLELLSGKKPINSCKGQESLVMWAKPILESGKLSGILDPNLRGNFNECQMQRMVLAATLCLTRAARLRPTMAQILKLLKGEENMESWAKAHVYEQEKGETNNFDVNDDNDNEDDDEVYQNSSAKQSHLSLALLDIDQDDFTSFSSLERIQSPCLEDFLKGRCSID